MTKQELLLGDEFTFNNELWCEENLNDDFRSASVSFETRTQMFVIWFNGAVVHCSKTFKALEKKLSKLSDTWNLEPSEDEDGWC